MTEGKSAYYTIREVTAKLAEIAKLEARVADLNADIMAIAPSLREFVPEPGNERVLLCESWESSSRTYVVRLENNGGAIDVSLVDSEDAADLHWGEDAPPASPPPKIEVERDFTQRLARAVANETPDYAFAGIGADAVVADDDEESGADL